MKKYLSLFMMVAMLFAASSVFTSCKGDDDNGNGYNVTPSPIAGSWVAISEYDIDKDGIKSNFICSGDKWVFTDNTLTIYSSNEKYNQFDYKYTWNGWGDSSEEGDATYSGEITSGGLTLEVQKLYKTRLEIKQKTSTGYNYTYLMKEGSNIQNEEQYIKQFLIGTWEVVSDETVNKTGKLINKSRDELIWVFTDTTFTTYDNYDLLYGLTIDYTCSDAHEISYYSFFDAHPLHTGYDIEVDSKTLKLVGMYFEEPLCNANIHRLSDYTFTRTIIFKKREDIPRWTDTMDITFDATPSSQYINLNKLDNRIKMYTSSDNPWAFAYLDPFKSVSIHVLENTSTSSRTCDITLEGAIGNKLIIHVIQQGKDETPNP